MHLIACGRISKVETNLSISLSIISFVIRNSFLYIVCTFSDDLFELSNKLQTSKTSPSLFE